MKKLLIILAFVTFFLNGNAQLYTQYAKAGNIDSLIQKLFASPNVQISNITFKGYYFPSTGLNGNIRDIGYFNSVNSTVGIDSGLVLTGGMLAAPYGLGQPANVNASFMKATSGDPDLDSLIHYPNVITQGAAVVEFDFTPNGDSIKFEYVFASDEYPNQICTEDEDLFAFFISGPGIVGKKNIALVPGTNFPVGNSSINDVATFSLTPNLTNCYSTSFPQLYVDHLLDTNFIFNGSTTVLTAGHKTIPCQTYHLKLAIAECGGLSDNSAVFLKANSFNSEPIKITSKVNFINGDTALYESCSGAKLIIRRTYNIQSSKTYSLNFSGSAINGVDYQTLPSTITMLPNQMYDTIYLQPIQDLISDNFENIILKIGDTLCNGNYYEAKIEFTILEKNMLKAVINSDQRAYCDTAKLIVNIINGLKPTNINWLDGEGTDSLFKYYPITFGDGYYINKLVFVSVSDGCGQFDKDTINVTFSKKPKADFYNYPNYIEALLTNVFFTNVSSKDANQFKWNLSDDAFTSEQKDISYAFLDTGHFNITLVVSNQFNCKDSLSKAVTVNEPNNVFIPNSFTPNNDGLNDRFKPIIKNYKIATMKIFNRWGNLILSTTDMEQGWDGRYENLDSPPEVYVYQLEIDFIDGTTKLVNGRVILVR